MHRPKHTSELYSDLNKKRQQLRSKAIHTVAPPASGYTTRPSCIAVQSCMRPLDRAVGGDGDTYLKVSVPKLKGLTTLKTKQVKKNSAGRLPFKTETKNSKKKNSGRFYIPGCGPIAALSLLTPITRVKAVYSKACISDRLSKQRGLATRKTKVSKKQNPNHLFLTTEPHYAGSGEPAGTGPTAVLNRPPSFDRAESGYTQAHTSVPVPRLRGLTPRKAKLSKKKSSGRVFLTTESYRTGSGNLARTGNGKTRLSASKSRQRRLTTQKSTISKKKSSSPILLTPETHCNGSGEPVRFGPITTANWPPHYNKAEGGCGRSNIPIRIPRQRGSTTQKTLSNDIYHAGSGDPGATGSMAVLRRPSVLDRAEGGYSKAQLSASTPKQRGLTTRKPKLAKKKITNRIQFASKTHCTGYGNPAVNEPIRPDKKWLHDQSRRIGEYLLKFPVVNGISTNFLNRGLLQMSIKQFVAVVNFFLRYVCGNRFVVGKNYIDDIIDIMQKLKYPHAADKAWDNIENIIALLDYFMDFVPPSIKEDSVIIGYFPIRATKKVNISRSADYTIVLPAFEFQYQLLSNSEDGFVLWDNYMDDEFKHLQKATIDTLIQRICKFSGTEAIEREMYKLRKTLKALEGGAIIHNAQLIKNAIMEKKRKLNDLRIENVRYNKIYQRNKLALKRLHKTVAELSEEVIEQEEQVKLQLLKKQQLDQLNTEQRHMKKMCNAQAVAIHNLEDRCNKNMILHGRFLQYFADQVAMFNEHARQIADCNKLPLADFKISLHPDVAKLEKLLTLLHQTKEMMEESIIENETNLFKINSRTRVVCNETDFKLETQLQDLRSSATRWRQQLQEIYEEDALTNAKIQNMQIELVAARNYNDEQLQIIAWKTAEIEYLKETNELTMRNAEENHRRWMAQKWAAFRAYAQLVRASQLQEQQRQYEN